MADQQTEYGQLSPVASPAERIPAARRDVHRSMRRLIFIAAGLAALVAIVIWIATTRIRTGTDEMSHRAGYSAGYQMGAAYRTMSRDLVTENEIRSACDRQVLAIAMNGYSWGEDGIAYDIRADDVDEPSASDGCIEGVKAALRDKQ